MKKGKIALLALSSALLLSGCGKVSAELSNPDDPIVVKDDGTTVEVDNNTIKYIFDQIKNGDNYTTSVRDILTEAIAKAYVGDYRVDDNGQVYIEGLDLENDQSVFDFVSNHKFYWNWVSTGSRVEYEEEVSMSNVEEYRERIASYINLVQKEIVKSLYDEAVVAAYMKNNKFYEVLYAKSIYEQMFTVYNENGTSVQPEILYETPDFKNESNRETFENAGFTFGTLVTRDYDPESDYQAIISGDTQLLHLYHYVDYINVQIMPDIISNLLTQSYIYERQYQSIGRTQARKVNFVRIQDNDKNNAEELVRLFIEEYVSQQNEKEIDYTALIEAWNGDYNELNSENSSLDNETKELASSLAEDVFGTPSNVIESEFASYIDGKTGDDYLYYDGSLYGDLINDYSYLTNNPNTNDSTLYEEFTSLDGVSYSPEEGLAERTKALKIDDYVTNEWGTSSDFNLGDTNIVTQLFSYGLATEFETATDPDTPYIVDGYYLKQFVKGGPTFLKKRTYTNEFDSVLWSYEDSYYVIEVVDQVSLDTLALSADATSEERSAIENYAREIGYTVASDGTYTQNALLYYLEQSNINYYDQDVYDYFESEFPDLFD